MQEIIVHLTRTVPQEDGLEPRQAAFSFRQEHEQLWMAGFPRNCTSLRRNRKRSQTESSTEKMERTLPIATTSAELCGECACIAAMTTTNF